MSTQARRLRTKRPEDTSELFDYDLSLPSSEAQIIYKAKTTGGASGKSRSERKRKRRERQERVSGPPAKRSLLVKEADPAGPTNPAAATVLEESQADPLRPSIFLGHHRRMEREEKRMQQLEKVTLASLAERSREHKLLLESPNWRNEISRIVRIENLADTAEMAAKRRLALAEIDSFFVRYAEFRRGEREIRELRDRKPRKQRKKKKPLQRTPPPAVVQEPLTLLLRPTAFGRMVPALKGRPREFLLPESWRNTQGQQQE